MNPVKTNAARILDRAGIPYDLVGYEVDDAVKDAMLWTAILISLKTAAAAMAATAILGLFAAKWISCIRNRALQNFLDTLLTLPLVLPPTVIGFLLLLTFGANRPVGRFFLEHFDFRIAFSWTATVIAATVVAFPLMYRASRGALEQVPRELAQAAATLGIPERKIFWRIILPNALPGVAAGCILAFARGMGEFGATAMLAGNIAGVTRTLPLAVYSATASGDMDAAFNTVLAIVVLSFLIVAAMNRLLSLDNERRR